jgi:hypothetical protein
MISKILKHTNPHIKCLKKSPILLATLCLSVIIPILLFYSPSFASGWHDFELDIGDGFSIIRANSLDVVLANSDGIIIHGPYDYEDVGPIIAYSMSGDYIYTKNVGRYKRNLFEGDTFEEVDYGKEFYFIVNKKSESIDGPLTETQFNLMHQELGGFKVKWEKPRNPNFLLPLIGDLMFLVFSFFILAGEYYYVSLPMLGLGIIVIAALLKKRRAYRMSSE